MSHKKVWYAPNGFEAYGEEEIKAVEEALRAGWLAPGARTAEFEQKVASWFKKRYGVMVNSGSSANLIAISLLDLQPQDEVVTAALTFSTTLAPIVQSGATPVFVDAEEGMYVPSVSQILAAVTPKTKAIMIPNLIGNLVDWKALKDFVDNDKREKKIVLIEDCCDTFPGTEWSDISTTSHVITAGGGGGMIMVNSKELQQKILMYRDWGRIGNNSEDMSERFTQGIDGITYDFKFLYGVVGFNLKSTEMNAAFGLVQLTKLQKFLEIRRKNIERYLRNLEEISDFLELPNDKLKPNWLAIPLAVKGSTKREDLLKFLEENNVQTRVCFAGNVTRHPAYRKYLKPFPIADRYMERAFLLGAHHGLTEEDVDYVCNVIKQYFKDKQ